MSRPHEWDWKEAILGYFAPLLLSLGMSLTMLRALLPDQALWPAALLCAGFTLVFYALFSLPYKRKWLMPLIAVIGLGVWGALGGGPGFTLIQLGKAGVLVFKGVSDAAAPYADDARWAVCLLFSLVAAALCWDRTLPLAIFTVVTIVVMAYLLGAEEKLILCAVPAAAGLLLLAAEEKGRRVSALAVAALVAAAAFLLLPARAQTWQPLEKVAERVREFVEDYLLFSEYRTSFSLITEGFQPLEERLGGPAEPEAHNVMEVTTDRTVLLRAKTYDDYTGLNWYDSLSTRRYLAASPRFSSLRDELFDLSRPLCGDTLSPLTLHVHMLNSAATTLYAPARTRTLQPESERMVLYYNLAAEQFITRDLKAGDDYTLTYVPYAPGSAATEEAVRACEGLEDAHYAEVSEQYLAIPRHIQQEIYDIAAKATRGCSTPYEKALAIQNYLKKNYKYNLNVNDPPDGVDFVAWFLIGEKEGYCTYFATAMTMLCRIVGVPARYVTGYLAIPDDSGVALVTGKQAHAWTEVYLNGFGWLDFDATPRSDNNRGSEMDNGRGPVSGPSPSPSPDPLDLPSPSPSPTATPSPSPEPSPGQSSGPQDTPTPKPKKTPTPEPSEQPPENGPDHTPTPTPPPGATPTPDPDGKNSPDRESPPFPWWLPLLILAVLALILWRFLATEPVRRARRHPGEGADILFGASLRLLSDSGLARRSQETLHDFAARAEGTLAEKQLPSLTPLVDRIAAQVYGRHPADAAPFEAAYLSIRKAASPLTRFFAMAERMLGKKRG